MKLLKQSAGIIFHILLPLAVLGGAVFAVTMMGVKQKPNRKKPPPKISVPVDVVRAKPHDGAIKITSTGTVVPFRDVNLASEVAGRVVWKSESLMPGKFINQGDELLRIDARDYELGVARLEQQLQKADTDLAKVAVDKENAIRLIELAKETLALRTRELDRMKTLRRSQATSGSEYDAAEKTFVEAKQQLTTQENLLRGLEAETKSLATAKQLAAIGLDQAKLDLQRTTIRAPFSGVVIDNMVEANSHVQVGAQIATVEDTSRAEVRCSLRKEDLEFLPSIGDSAANADNPADAYRLPPIPVTVRYARAGREYSWQGVLSRQDGLGMDQRTRTMPVRILVPDPLKCEVTTAGAEVRPIALVRGMFVHVDLHCMPNQPMLTIPEDTIRPGKTVWVMENEKLRITPIQIARIEGGVAYVDSLNGQLSRGDTIIRSPVPGAKDGLAVTTNVPKPGAGGGRKGGKGRGGKGGTAGGKPGASPGPKPTADTDATAERPRGPKRPIADDDGQSRLNLVQDEGADS